MKGKRKFYISILALLIFTVVKLTQPETNPQELGIGLGVILFGFGIPNMAEHGDVWKK